MVQWCRGTFQGQAYGPFSDIPAVWDATFGSKSYSALAAGVAGKRTAPLCPPCIPTNASSLPLKPGAAAHLSVLSELQGCLEGCSFMT